MTKYKQVRFPILGIILVLIGTGLLLDRLGYVHFGWEKIIACGLMVYGAGLTLRAFFVEERGKVFFGTAAFLFGVLIFLSSLDLIVSSPHLFLPASLIIIGLSFIMIFVQDTKEWGVLIPGILLSGIGSVYIFVKLGHLGFYMITRIVEVYWPLLLIAIGLSLLLRRSISEKSHAQETSTSGEKIGNQ